MSETVEKKPGKLPILLSMVFPGLGQVFEKRWISAVIFGAPTLICMYCMTVTSATVVSNGFEFLANMNDIDHPDLPIRSLLVQSGVITALVIVSVIDVVVAYLRASKEWTRKRVAEAVSQSVES